ncbi:Cytochrome P450 monooxygenase FSL4 [Paramyrothecium foliicola]|nr:Cytochrome P450 monooxygenase FSL4 [Paramyrothecium foliicola]
MPGTSFAETRRRIEGERVEKLYGVVSIAVRFLKFPDESLTRTVNQSKGPNHRKESSNNDIFQCISLENRTAAVIAQETLEEALAESSLTISDLSRGPAYVELRLPAGVTLECLGAHRTPNRSSNYWIVELYQNDLSDELKRMLVESHDYQRRPDDGEIYIKVREYQGKKGNNNPFFANLWLEYLSVPANKSSNRKNNLNLLLKHQKLLDAFDKLLDIPALFCGFRLSVIHGLISMKCDEPNIHYLTKHLHAWWYALCGGDLLMMRQIDRATVEAVEGMAPGANKDDHNKLQQLLLTGKILGGIPEPKKQELWERMCNASRTCLIPSLFTFFEDRKFLACAAETLRHIFDVKPGNTLTCTLEGSFTDINQKSDRCKIQVSSRLFATIPGDKEVRKDLGIQQLWLAAGRDHNELPPEPRKKVRLVQPKTALNASTLFELASLAFQLGFESDKIYNILKTDPDRQIAEQALQTARRPEYFQYLDREESIQKMVDIFRTATAFSNSSAVGDFSRGECEKTPRRYGTPLDEDQKYERIHLFLPALEDYVQERNGNITTLFIRKSVYWAYFGRPPSVAERTLDHEAADNNISPTPSVSTSHKESDPDKFQINLDTIRHFLGTDNADAETSAEPDGNFNHPQKRGHLDDDEGIVNVSKKRRVSETNPEGHTQASADAADVELPLSERFKSGPEKFPGLKDGTTAPSNFVHFDRSPKHWREETSKTSHGKRVTHFAFGRLIDEESSQNETDSRNEENYVQSMHNNIIIQFKEKQKDESLRLVNTIEVDPNDPTKDNVFFFGQSLKILATPWAPDLFCHWSRKWPDSPLIRYKSFGNADTLLVNSVDAYRDVLLRKSSSFVKPHFARLFTRDFIGDGLPFAEGHMHKLRRGALLRSFSTTQSKSQFPRVQAKARQLADVLSAGRNPRDEVEVESNIWKAVLDVIGEKTFGVDLNHLESNQSPLFESISYLMQPSQLTYLVNYLNMFLPVRKLFWYGQVRDFECHSQKVRTYIRGTVRARRIVMQTSQSGLNSPSEKVLADDKPTDVLQCLLQHADPHWQEDQIVEYILNVLVLGHDTTACSMIWAVHELSRRPQEQQHLRQEIQDMYNSCHEPAYSDIEKLPYLNNFVQEVLRVYSAVSFVPREAVEDVEVDGVWVPKGTVLQLSPAVINLHPNVWGERSTEFDPRRWEDPKGPATNAYALQTFHNGPRMCIGKQLAIMEIKAMLIELVMRFQFENMVGEVEVAKPTLTLRPKTKLSVRLKDSGLR